MTDQGNIVIWTETDEATGRRVMLKRKFSSRTGASMFRAGLIAYSSEPVKVDLFDLAATPDKTIDEQNRDGTDVKNRRALVELMLKHGITIPAREFDKWRPTVEKTGSIAGVADGLMCIMTDGLLGYFLREDREPLYGHIQHFKWDIPDVSYIPYWNEQGEKKFFKQVRDQGAPPPLFKRPPKLVAGNQTSTSPKVKKPRTPMTSESALDLIRRMTLNLKNQGVNSTD